MEVEHSGRRQRGLIRPPHAVALHGRVPGRRRHFAWGRLLAGIGCVAIATPALADNWQITESVSASETYTSNVNYSTTSNSTGDFATSVTGAIQISGQGARARLNGSIGATAIVYANETQNNSFAPTVILAGNLEAIEKFLYIDAQANISQQFFSAFGPQPGSIVNATGNRYTAQTYSLSPYIQGRIGGTNLTYQVRDDNVWTLSSQFGNASVDAPSTYLNQLHGSLNAPAAPWGWTIEYTGTRYAPTNGDTLGSYTVQVGRGIAIYQFDPQFQVSARGGYESDRFPLQSSDGVIYGLGLQWLPSDRTQVAGFWEHRFFGSSYSATVNHRLPRSSLAFSFARGLNTYPQNALTIPAGANVSSFVDAAFATRIPDPAERALAVQQFLAQSGLPPSVSQPVNIFSASILLQTTGTASVVLIGLRNSVAFSVYYTKSSAISGTGSVLPPILQFGQDNTQTGGGVSFSHRLSGMTNLVASATYSRTTANNTTGAFANARTNNGYLSVGLGTQLGPKTTASLGVNYSRFLPDGDVGFASTSTYNVVAGINHTF
jgi:uncharacterized protein (PEP-CTERM system associated)